MGPPGARKVALAQLAQLAQSDCHHSRSQEPCLGWGDRSPDEHARQLERK